MQGQGQDSACCPLSSAGSICGMLCSKIRQVETCPSTVDHIPREKMHISHKALRRSIKSSAIAQHSFFDLYPSIGGLVDACVSCADDSVDIDTVTVSPESSQIKPVQFHESHFRGSGEWIDHQTYALHKSREVRNQERRGLLLECRCAKG